MDVLEEFLLLAPVLLFSLVAHEYAHGYAALRQGDDTAYKLGRLTWNPAKHIDPVMTVIVPASLFILTGGKFLFGGAKPVPVDPRRYRNFKSGDIIVSLAGIATNLVLAAIIPLVIIGAGLVGRALPVVSDTLFILQIMLIRGVQVNLILALFNLLPIPPLDGSHVMKYLLPPQWSLAYQRVGAYGFVILMLVLTVFRPVISAWMAPVQPALAFAMRVVSPYLLPNPWS